MLLPPAVDARCVHATSEPQQEWSNATVVVIAQFREWSGQLPSWLPQQYPVFQYQRLDSTRPSRARRRQ